MAPLFFMALMPSFFIVWQEFKEVIVLEAGKTDCCPLCP